MTVTTDVLIPALEDTRAAHAAVIDRFRSDLAVTPAGAHRQALERHVADARDHVTRIDRHVRDLRPRRTLRDAAELARIVAADLVRTARLPLETGALIAGGILRGRRQAGERRLLKNAEDEYAVAARALAVCRAGQSIAEQAHDEEAAGLLASLCRQDEQLLQTLEGSVAERARAVVAANGGGRRAQADGGLTGAATRAVRTTADRVRDAARTGGQQTARTAADTVRQMPGVTRVAEEAKGAATREEDLPISGYGRLNATDITERLRTLSQADLDVIEGYERAHANRTGVVNAIERLRGSQPWPGYDTMNADQITARLRTADPATARQAMDYERRHRQRDTVITAAGRRTTT
jgi:hypothetical protein